MPKTTNVKEKWEKELGMEVYVKIIRMINWGGKTAGEKKKIIKKSIMIIFIFSGFAFYFFHNG